jgi:voltage-gated potassium channel
MLAKIKQRLLDLYEGETDFSHQFRYLLLGIDLGMILYVIISTFVQGGVVTQMLDIVCGFYLVLDYLARLWISPRKLIFFVHPLNVADMIAIVSFLSPLLGVNYGFLRGLRLLRLFRSPRLLDKLRQDFVYFRQHEEVILSAITLFVFIFLMTELVFVTQVNNNPHVTNFLDALYFTIAALTTTGFGDVTLQGQSGRALSIIIMIFGVTLFLRLVHAIFRPAKVRFNCDDCGLFLHENDAVHCKHCGTVLNIPSDGTV